MQDFQLYTFAQIPHWIEGTAIFSDAELLKLYVFLHFRKAWQPQTVTVDTGSGRQTVSLATGQALIGRIKGAEALGWKPSTFRDRLKRLEKTGAVKLHPHTHYTIVEMLGVPRETRQADRGQLTNVSPTESSDQSPHLDHTTTDRRQAETGKPVSEFAPVTTSRRQAETKEIPIQSRQQPSVSDAVTTRRRHAADTHYISRNLNTTTTSEWVVVAAALRERGVAAAEKAVDIAQSNGSTPADVSELVDLAKREQVDPAWLYRWVTGQSLPPVESAPRTNKVATDPKTQAECIRSRTCKDLRKQTGLPLRLDDPMVVSESARQLASAGLTTQMTAAEKKAMASDDRARPRDLFDNPQPRFKTEVEL